MLERGQTPSEITQFERYHTRDGFDRLITFYISKAKVSSALLPLAVSIQGSGCHSVFRIGENGRVLGGYQNLLLRVARDRARVLVVEKPGVNYLDNPTTRGTAEHCSSAFLEEHTLLRWAAALEAALIAAQTLPDIASGKLLIVGHSEGGIVAARLTAEHQNVTHVAILSGSGPTQLFDIVEEAGASGSPGMREERVRDVYETFANIRADPESISNFAWGHPYRRWSSFLATSTLDELLRSRAQVYVAHGANDTVVPITAFEVLRAELIRHGRQVTAERIEEADHNFHVEGRGEIELVTEILSHVISWFTDGKL